MQRLQRVDQHAGDVLAAAQHVQRGWVALAQRERVSCGHRVAGARLHIVPPAVVRAAKAHDLVAPGVVTRQPYRLHDRLGARHMEGHLVKPGDLTQSPQVVENAWMVGAENRAERAHGVGALVDAFFVEVVAKQIDSVRACQVIGPVSICILHLHAVRGFQEGAHAQVLAQVLAVLERDPVGAGELKIRHRAFGFGRQYPCLGIAPGKFTRQAGEGELALRDNVRGSAVRIEKTCFVVMVAGYPARDAFGPAHMAGQRRILGARQRKPLHRFWQQPRNEQSGRGHCAEFEIRVGHLISSLNAISIALA